MNDGLNIFILILAMLIVTVVLLKFGAIRYVYLVPEGYAGLLYHEGKFAGVLGVGRHVRWGRFYSTRLHDLRKTSLLVAGQEVLTADNVGLKASVLVTYQVADPVKATHDTQNWSADLHHAAQLALRAVMGGIAVETLLGQRLELGAQLLARVQPDMANIGINVLAVEVKDVMFAADLKRAFAEVLKAKQEGQAALERPWRKRRAAQSRQRSPRAGRQSGPDEPAFLAVAHGGTECGQHTGSWYAGRLRTAQIRRACTQRSGRRCDIITRAEVRASARLSQTQTNQEHEIKLSKPK
jgi:regulator of protease activity HflC (stomatin/prohibitin superfamily)